MKTKLPKFQVKSVVSSLSEVQGWGIKQLNIPKVWEKTRGEGITVYVLDTGAVDHVDISNIQHGMTFIGNSDKDFNGHSTAVSGVICADNDSDGMVGVAPSSRVVTVKVLGDGGEGSIKALLQGLSFVLSVSNGLYPDLPYPDVVCMSLGVSAPIPYVHAVIKKLYEKGIPIVCAAGNSGQAGDNTVNYPAVYPETISVAAYDENGDIAYFSSKGKEVDVAAPGVDIYTCWLNNQYVSINGTSFAAPFVAGLIALILSQSDKEGKPRPTVSRLIEILISYSNDKGEIGKDNKWGYGVVDINKIINKERPINPDHVDRLSAGYLDEADKIKDGEFSWWKKLQNWWKNLWQKN